MTGSAEVNEAVPASLDGERLDRFVALVVDCSRNVAADLIQQGLVTVDAQVQTRRSTRLAEGDVVQFERPEIVDERPGPDSLVQVPVVFVDDHILVVNKPAGLVVHPGSGVTEATMVNGLLAEFPEIAEVGDAMRPGIVHRLDRGTTGLLVVARSTDAYDPLVEALASRTVGRHYATVVWGAVDNDNGVVDAPIGRSNRRRTHMAVIADGRPAVTHYEVLARRFETPTISRLVCRLETGRTHQIRVHFDAIGHPVVGDDKYNGRRQGIEFDRPALHAHRLQLQHPVTGEQLEFEAEMPADLAGLIDRYSLEP